VPNGSAVSSLELELREAELVAGLAALDQRFEAGLIPEAEYRSLRAAKSAALAEVMRGLGRGKDRGGGDDMSKRRRSSVSQPTRRGRSWKPWAFLLIVIVVAAGAAWLLRPVLWAGSAPAVGGDVVEIKGTMGGFSLSVIRAQEGRPLTVRLTSVDNRFHTDGGGKHQFAIDALGVNIIAPPLGTREVTFTPTKPGVYEYYCDVCCGGRANPTMQGKLIVEA
jgi:hypothetical protein